MELVVEGIGDRIRERRKAKGLTQVQLADQVGIGSDMVSKHEGGRMGVRSETLMAYAKALDTTAEYLAGKAEAPPRPVLLAPGMGKSPLRTVTPPGGLPMSLARLLNDGRCNPLTDEEISHLTRHLNDGNSPELDDLEVHLLAHRAERDRTKQSVERFREAVLRAAKARGQHEVEHATQTRALPPASPTTTARKKPVTQ